MYVFGGDDNSDGGASFDDVMMTMTTMVIIFTSSEAAPYTLASKVRMRHSPWAVFQGYGRGFGLSGAFFMAKGNWCGMLSRL